VEKRKPLEDARKKQSPEEAKEKIRVNLRHLQHEINTERIDMEVIQEDLFVLLERLQGEKDAAVKMINKSKATALHAGALAVLRAQENAVDLESSSTETSSPRPLTKSVFREKDDRDRFIQFIKGSMQPLKECAIVSQTMLDTLKVAQEKEVAMYMEKMQSLAQKQRMDLHLLEVTGRKENQLQQIKELEEEKYLQCQIESMILHKQQLAARHEKALQRMTADQKQKLQALSTRMQLATVKACKDIDKKVKTEEECVYAEHYVNVRGLKHMEKKLVHTLTNRQDTLVRNAQKHYEGSNAAPQMIIASLEKEIKVLLGRIELQQQKAQEIHAGNERMKRTLVSREAEIARTQDLIGRAEEVRAMVKRVQADLRATTGRIREVVWKTCVKEDTLKKMQVERTKFLAAMTENVRAVQQRRASLSADLELASMAVFVRLQEEEERWSCGERRTTQRRHGQPFRIYVCCRCTCTRRRRFRHSTSTHRTSISIRSQLMQGMRKKKMGSCILASLLATTTTTTCTTRRWCTTTLRTRPQARD
jgi:hypothetical protein